MKIKDLKNDKDVKRWFRNVNGAEHTEKNYLNSMQKYTEFLNMTPEQLLDEAEQEMGLSARKKHLKDHILDFREELKNQGLADSTIKNRIACIRSFYLCNEINLPKIRGEKSKPIQENEKIPTKEDLQDCISVCDPLEKAIMLAGISSGLASNEIRNLKLKQFRDGYDPETQITTLSLRRGKTDVDFITFFSPEASKAISEYLEFRDRPRKARGLIKNAQAEKQRTTPDSYLFINKSVPAEYLETHNEESRKLSEIVIAKLYRNISEKARKSTKHGSYNFIRSHTMRKYFNSCLLNAGCDSFHTELWMGHQLPDTQPSYFRADKKAQKEIYLKFMPYLTIQKELNVAESPEFIKIKNENEVLARETAKATVEREELVRMKAQMKQSEKNMYIQILETRRDSKIEALGMIVEMFPEKADEIKIQIEDTEANYNMFIKNVKTKESFQEAHVETMRNLKYRKLIEE